MSASHGWNLDALQNYEADKREKERNREVVAFHERAADLAERYRVDENNFTKEYAVDYENLVLDHAHLRDSVPEIAEFLAQDEIRKRFLEEE